MKWRVKDNEDIFWSGLLLLVLYPASISGLYRDLDWAGIGIALIAPFVGLGYYITGIIDFGVDRDGR